MFFQMCNVEMGNDKARCTEELCGIKPLEDGELCRIVEGKKVWYPNWRGEVKDPTNSSFLMAVVEHIWWNEKVSTQISLGTYTYAPNRHSEIPITAEARWRTGHFPSS
jgi:hypothetical protein